MSPPLLHRAAQAAARRSLLRFSRRIPREVRDELCQEAVLRLLTAEGVRSPAAFAWQVARRLALDHLRAERPRAHLPDLPCSRGTREADLRHDVRRVLEALPAGHGRALVSMFLEGHDVDDLIPAGASIDRARSALYKRRARALGHARELFPDLAA